MAPRRPHVPAVPAPTGTDPCSPHRAHPPQFQQKQGESGLPGELMEREGQALPEAESEHPKLDPAVSHCLAASFSPACPGSRGHLTAGRVIPPPSLRLQRQHRGGGGRKHGCHGAKTTSCLVSSRAKPAAHVQGRDDGGSSPATGSGDRTTLTAH